MPSTNFHPQQLSHPEAAEIGCAPDFNAWTDKENIPPADFAKNTFRSCGGHIHVGYVEGSGNDFLLDAVGKRRMIQAMDCLHGMISVLLDNSKEAIERRNIYGKAGCYRPTDYGVEYRTLSNFWCRTDNLKRLMYRLTADALYLVRTKVDESYLLDFIIKDLDGPENIQNVINTGNVEYVKDNWCLIEQNMSTDTQINLVEVFHE